MKRLLLLRALADAARFIAFILLAFVLLLATDGCGNGMREWRNIDLASYRTIRQSEMRMYHPSKFTEMVVLSNRHPFPDSPSILEESHELKCVSVSNRTEGICLLYSGFGSGEPFHNVKKNDLLIFQFDKDDNLVGVVDKGGKTIGFAPSLLSDDNRSSPRTPSASPAELKPHAESAEGAEDESHAESAEDAEP